MSLTELFIIATGLSMDAFAVAVCHGLSMQKLNFKKMLIVGMYFGTFQALMPLIGYLIGSQFADNIAAYDHWLAFGLLGLIGFKMIRDSFKTEELPEEEVSLKVKDMLILAVATSIDALAAGISFAFLDVQIVPAVSFIGIITLVLSMLGVKIGNIFGAKFKSKAELIGGVTLTLMGIKILLEHTGVIAF